jgi:formylglycine-generating enzyme required for sulfatase activity
MVLIPAGEFLMGSDPQKDEDAEGAEVDEEPQHRLFLPDYYIARTPATNAQYAAFVEAMHYSVPEHWEDQKPPRGKEDHPVVSVTSYDALAYCRWLAEITGKPYRLPSEAEWEKAARGTDGRIYPWGNDWDAKRCNTSEGGKRDTTPVGSYPQGASPYGLSDMAGNVSEWCHSFLRPYPYDAKDGREDEEDWDARVSRGGSFAYQGWLARCACRDANPPHFWFEFVGFRVCVALRQD